MRPRLLDLFCGAGGAAVGYHRAGFDVVGVDIKPQPNFPFEFIQDDVIEPAFLLDWQQFDAIHASPPCQAYSLASLHNGVEQQKTHPDLVAPTREFLSRTGLPWVIENVVGSPVAKHVLLCGEMFGLRVHRHRYFETGGGFYMLQPSHERHVLRGAFNNCHIEEGYARQVVGNYANHADASAAMGIDWMDRGELALAVPPAYTELIGHQLVAYVESREYA